MSYSGISLTSVFEFLNKMKKRSRTVVRYQMNFEFFPEKKLKITSLEKIKKILSCRSVRQLDNLELLQSLFDMVDTEDVGNDSSSTTTTPCQRRPMLENSGMFIFLFVL